MDKDTKEFVLSNLNNQLFYLRQEYHSFALRDDRLDKFEGARKEFVLKQIDSTTKDIERMLIK